MCLLALKEIDSKPIKLKMHIESFRMEFIPSSFISRNNKMSTRNKSTGI